MSTILEAFNRIAVMPANDFVSEEDVKIKVVLPMLRALGYDDADFNYEGRTGRGYADVTVDRFPVGIIVEAKSPRTKLENYVDQLESYVFHKHRSDRAIVAILTNGELFLIYGVTETFWRGSLANYQIESFGRSQIGNPELAGQLGDLLGKEKNQAGAIIDVITRRQKEMSGMRERLQTIETELNALTTERETIGARIQDLEAERASILGSTIPAEVGIGPVTTSKAIAKYPACPHVLRLLEQRGAHAKATAVERKWLDEQLIDIDKVEGVATGQAVSWGLIELKKASKIDYEKRGGSIGPVWLK